MGAFITGRLLPCGLGQAVALAEGFSVPPLAFPASSSQFQPELGTGTRCSTAFFVAGALRNSEGVEGLAQPEELFC